METQSVQVAIIGSGFGGQCAAINLVQEGIDDFVILERRDFAGGTWVQNTYPGAAVDVQSPLYSLSFEPYDWSQMFVEQHELKDYTNYILDKYRLREKVELSCNVEALTWHDDDQHWHITTNKKTIIAKFVINASGPLSTPVVPDFKGRDTFRGEAFHTNDWNHDYDYRDKRVAVIGSGASAAQVIPEIVDDVAALHIFQRTPHWIMPRPDRTFKQWERKLLRNNWIYQALRKSIYWSLESRVIGMKYSTGMLKIVAQRQAEKLLEEQIQNPELRAKLTPDYLIGCKRIILSNTLLPAFAHQSTTFHAQDDGIAEITPTGITTTGITTTQGDEIELDLIVYATGYDATDGVISYPVRGRNDQLLQDFWADYPRAYLGTAIPNFPNLFIVTGPNTGIGHTSAIFVIESQMRYIMDSIQRAKSGTNHVIEVKAESEQAYTDKLHKEMEGTVWQSGGCNSWYKSKSGKVIAMYPGFTFVYRHLARHADPRHHTVS